MKQRGDLPGGTVTFLFTDIEGSTQLLQRLRDRYKELLVEHHRIVRQILDSWQGREVSTEGDAFFVSFTKATQAVAAAVEVQRTLTTLAWPEGVHVKVRMGLHTGEPWIIEEDYAGLDVHRAARIAHAGHGGQVLLSETTAALVWDELPEGVTLVDLGQHQLKDMRRPERLHQLAIDGLTAEFPPLKSLSPVEAAMASQKEAAPPPAFLVAGQDRPSPLFVGRQRELNWLLDRINLVLVGAGASPVLFVTGEAGRGKSSLLDEFARQAQEQHGSLVVARGICNAFSGTGDPYLPFRQILSLLAGDVESEWAGGTISRDQAVRLWRLAPFTLQKVLADEQVLIDTLLPSAVLARISLAHQDSPVDWQEALERIRHDRSYRQDLEQRQLFEQCYELLFKIAGQRPLLLLLDDLQWADSATINLLFHLGRRLAGSPTLIVGAYRPSEVALGRSDFDISDNQRHPLEAIINEFKRLYGEIELNLSQLEQDEGLAFVEALLDSQPNQLDAKFRRALFERTKGHPLFTIELLRSLQEQEALVQDESGRWLAPSSLSWGTLPARIEAVIAQRIGRLSDDLRQIVTVASVEGELFTAQVVAQVLDMEVRPLLHALSQELENRHRLLRERDEIETGGQFLTRYQFRHALFQQYLYNSLSAGERRLLHHDIARALEALYSAEPESVVVQLAYHYRHAGERLKALDYARQAAERAETMFAFDEAIDYVNVALTLIRPGEQREMRLALLEKLADLHVLMGRHPQAVDIYQEAVGLRRSFPEEGPMALVRLHRKIGATVIHMTWFADRQQYEELAHRHLQAGLELADGRPPHEETVRLLIALAEEAWLARVHPDWEMAEKYANTAIKMAEGLEALVEVSAALNSLEAVYGARGLFRERLELSLRRLELSHDKRFKDTHEKARILVQTGRAMTIVGEFTDALPYLQQAESLSRQIHALDLLFYAYRNQAVCYYRMDQWDNVLYIESQWRVLEQQHINFEERAGPTCFFIALVAAVQALRGKTDEALHLREQSLAVMLANDGPADGWGRDNHY